MSARCPPDKVDFTVRWDRADYLAVRAVAASMGGVSAGALVRWVVLGWLGRQREVSPSPGGPVDGQA